MDILFFITTLITGIFIGVLALGGVFAIFVRYEDKKTEARRKSKHVDVMPGVHTQRTGSNPFN